MSIVFKNVLVLSPHTDDGELGAGAIINRLISEGSHVDYFAFSSCEESVPDGFEKDVLRKEVLDATKVLGISNNNVSVLDYKVRNFTSSRQSILDDLITIRKKREYDLVLLPASTDIHQDHKTIYQEGVRAFKNKTILGYELYWNQLKSNNTLFFKISNNHLDAKLESIRQYKSQYGRGYCKDENITSLAKVRGVQAGFEFAECFEVIRAVF